MPKHIYGYIRDRIDRRDFSYKRIAARRMFLPDSVDLRYLSSPVRDQGNLGSCVGFSMSTGMREFIINARREPFDELSPLYLYYHARLIEGTVNSDSGAELRDGMRVLLDKGCSTEDAWPYNISKFAVAPSSAAEASAPNYKISSYYRIESLEDAQVCLAQGSGFTIGFYVYESFDSDAVATTGKMPMPKDNEYILGGHAVFVVGYKNDVTWPGGGYLIVKNSWGNSWGDHGYFYMPFAFYTPDDVPDAWVAVVTDTASPSAPPDDASDSVSHSPSLSHSPSVSPSAPPEPPIPPEPTGCLPVVGKLVRDVRSWWHI